MTVAAVACATPALFKFSYVFWKFLVKSKDFLEKLFVQPLKKCLNYCCGFFDEELQEQEEGMEGAADDAIDAVKPDVEDMNTVQTTFLMANMIIALMSLGQYMSVAPYGKGLCQASFLSYAVVYRPFSISM